MPPRGRGATWKVLAAPTRGYTGRDFSAAEALAMGLVSKVLPDRDAAWAVFQLIVAEGR